MRTMQRILAFEGLALPCLAALAILTALVAAGCSDATKTTDATTPKVMDITQEEFITSPPANVLVLDVRTPAEYDAGHVPHAMNIPHDQLKGRLDELHATLDQPIVVYCKSGKRAAMAADVLVAAGYDNVHHLDGDMDGWRASGRPIE